MGILLHCKTTPYVDRNLDTKAHYTTFDEDSQVFNQLLFHYFTLIVETAITDIVHSIKGKIAFLRG